MAIIVDYGTLKTAVADYLGRSDLTSFIPNFIQAAENRIYRELRVRHMRASTTISVVGGDGGFTLPTNFLDLTSIIRVGNPYVKLERTSVDDAFARYPRGFSGAPKVYVQPSATTLSFYPSADGAYDFNVAYYKREAAMSGSTDAPWVVLNYPEMILYASLTEAQPFIMNDPRIAVWEQMYQQAKTAVMEQETRGQSSANKLRARVRN